MVKYAVFLDEDMTEDGQAFEKEVANLTKCSIWLVWMLALLNLPGFYYVFLKILFLEYQHDGQIRCKIPELEKLNWSFEQIKNITDPDRNLSDESGCEYIVYNYSVFSGMTFDQVQQVVQKWNKELPDVAPCKEYITAGSPHKTVYHQFQLLCGNSSYFIVIFVAEVMAEAVFGFSLFLGDIYGRKRIISWGANILLIGGVCLCLATSPFMLGLGHFLIHGASMMMRIGAEVIIIEIVASNLRSLYYFSLFIGGIVGHMLLLLLAGYEIHWRYKQIAVSSSLLLLPLLTWYVPESPLWLMSKKHKTLAWSVLKTMKKPEEQNDILLLHKNNNSNTREVIKEHFRETKELLLCRNCAIISIVFILLGTSYLHLFQDRLLHHIGEKTKHMIIATMCNLFQYVIPLPSLYILGTKLSLLLFCLAVAVCYTVCAVIGKRGMLLKTVFSLSEVFSAGDGILMSLLVLKMVPTTHRCTVLGMYNGVMSAVGHMALVIVAHQQFHYHTMFVVAAVVLYICFVVIIFLEEVPHHHMLTENIQEFLQRQQ